MWKGCWLSLLAGVAASLSGCAVGPDYLPPDISVPTSFGATSKTSSYAASAAAVTSGADFVRWWQALNDRQLNALVERAVASNLDIEAALTRVQRARTEEIVVLNAALPHVGVSAGVAAGTGTDLTKGRVADSLRAGSNAGGLQALSGIVGFDGGWELDLFGKYRRLLEAAHGDTEALDEMRHAVLITIIADVVRNYVELRALQSRLDTLRNDVTAAQKVRDEVQTRYDQGLTNELDVAQAKRELATLEAGLPELTAGIYAAENRMAVLLGTYSGAIVPELRRPGRIPHIPERLRSGTPLDLLRRRPDIRQAERELAAANARIGASIADLFPTVAVTAGVGAQGGPGLQNSTPSIHGPIWSIGPSGYLPFLDFGRLDALIDAQELGTHELLLKYKKTILAAVAEVDDAIKGYRAARQRLKDVETAVAESRHALDLATGRHEFVLLYKALGGGWERYELLPPIREPEPAIVAMFRRLSNQWQ
jgi:NodT family efflux transporter outer membrane factor (OMF) lipoprotein